MGLVGARPLARGGGLRNCGAAVQRLVVLPAPSPRWRSPGFGGSRPGLGQRSRPDLVSIGKVILVILATLVIFSTGLITGVVLVKQPLPKAAPVLANPPTVPQGPPLGMQQFLRRAQGELDLTPEHN